MKFIETLQEAISSIIANLTRSILTILGIVIGVGAVIALMAIGQGAQSTIIGQISSIGTNAAYIMRGNMTETVTNPRQLTLSDATALSNRLRAPHIANVSPVVSDNVTVDYGGESLRTSVQGVFPDYQTVQSINLAEGTFFSNGQVDARASVIVIGPEVANRLLGRTTGVIGSILRINDYPFRVIGVTVAKGGSQFINPDLNIYMPITSMQLRVSRSSFPNQVDNIIIQATDSSSVSLAIQEANAIMREAHRLNPGQPNDFTITNQQDFLSIANSITSVLTIFLSGIAGISLLVGGIGIMNIMLVSVTERTREIGLRKALGARKNDILLQFLTESALLSLIGGVIGIALGWGLSSLVGLYAANAGTPLVPLIGVNSILLATIFSTVVGLFFGWYPAQRAANLEPVDALRFE